MLRNYKWCFVPSCISTSTKTPNKAFVSVPVSKTLRTKWFTAVGRPNDVALKTHLYACEDHFDLPEDAENWCRYNMKFTRYIRIKDDVVPHIFEPTSKKITKVFSHVSVRRIKDLHLYKDFQLQHDLRKKRQARFRTGGSLIVVFKP